MRTISISDMTLKMADSTLHTALSFREKIELAKLLDKMNASTIELAPLGGKRVDSLLVRSVATAVKHAAVALPITPDEGGVEAAWAAVKEAVKPRLQVVVPTSPMQMEYFWHKKPEKMLKAIREKTAACFALCPDVELVCDDAWRAEKSFLQEAVAAAIEAGATRITLCDAAGTMFPTEIEGAIKEMYENVPALSTIHLGIQCADTMRMAHVNSFIAAQAGAEEIKVTSIPGDMAAIESVASIFATRGSTVGLECSLKQTQLKSLLEQVRWLCSPGRTSQPTLPSGKQYTEEMPLSVHDSREDIEKVIREIGYDLSDEDITNIFETFLDIAANKESVSVRELDSIIATSAMQVPPTWKLQHYAINSVNAISASAHLQLEKNGTLIEDITCGNGPIDAAFKCIEKIVGKHYELDDFQIRAVTEGHEAMGETVVRLRSEDKLYSGRGISTDIICSGIFAYLNALNKIAFEEAEA